MNRYTYVLNNPLKYIDPDGLDTADAWSQLSKEEQAAIQSKLKITKQHKTAQAAFNALVTAGTTTAQDVAKNVATVKNFISAVGGTKNSAVWQQIGTINSVDLRGEDQSSVLTLSVRSERGFTDALKAEGYSHNDPTDVWANQDKGRLDTLREQTPNSTDPELHFERTNRNPSEFNAHWDPTSVNFKYVRGRFEISAQASRAACYVSGNAGCAAISAYKLEQGWAALKHGTHPSPAAVRDYQKRVGLAPK